MQHDGAGDGRTGTGLTSPCASCARAIGCSAARMWKEIPHMGLLWFDRSGPRPEATLIANHRAFVSVPPPPHPMPPPLPAACCRSSCAPAVSSCSPALASSLRSSLAPLLSHPGPEPQSQSQCGRAGRDSFVWRIRPWLLGVGVSASFGCSTIGECLLHTAHLTQSSAIQVVRPQPSLCL